MTKRERRELCRKTCVQAKASLNSGIPPKAVLNPLLQVLVYILDDLDVIEASLHAHMNTDQAHNF